MTYTYKTKGTCAVQITFDIDGDVITNVNFLGGCNGNLKAISRVVDGMTVDQIQGYFANLTCGFKQTSCSDQLAKAVKAAYDETHSA
ncbi:MAG: TIGR03905 family TSCPD domain-containing protein [Clostridia bacterium]|nr:TIGR03905 family TSCPD domain-containing protein [Clostridia bacterium]